VPSPFEPGSVVSGLAMCPALPRHSLAAILNSQIISEGRGRHSVWALGGMPGMEGLFRTERRQRRASVMDAGAPGAKRAKLV
jgi:hypothetical protein